MASMIVMKFGGSSVESAEAIQRVAGIVRERLEQKPVVVVSAMGKTTNRLLQIAETAARGEDAALSLLADLRQFHRQEATRLGALDERQPPVKDLYQGTTSVVRGATSMYQGTTSVVPTVTPQSPPVTDPYQGTTSVVPTATPQSRGFSPRVRDSDERTAPRRALGAEHSLDSLFQELGRLTKALIAMRELTPRLTDAISAYGERLSSMIVARALRTLNIPAAHHDARQSIRTDDRHTQAVPLLAVTYQLLEQNLRPIIDGGMVPVMGGFIGSTEDGVTTTLGRGGSDYTASIVGAGIGAREIQIWTDVDGMLTADPTVISAVQCVETCSFAEAAELAYFGAKVLHPATVLPAIEKNIPVRILNSRRPEAEGTLIVSDAPAGAGPIRSIACKRNITLVHIVSSRMLMAHGFLRRIFEVFDRFETPVDMLATSEVSVSLTVDNARWLDAIRKELESFAEVSVEQDQAIVCLVGENIRQCPETTARVFRSLNRVHPWVKPRMVSQGASQLNLGLVVAAADLRSAVESLHREFFD